MNIAQQDEVGAKQVRQLYCVTYLVCLLVLPGCEMATVRVWERGDLARQEMQWEVDPMQSTLRQHVFTAKEGASGGNSTGGGGCGCY